MVGLSIDWKSLDDQHKAKLDREAATRVLLRLADFLGSGTVIGEAEPAIVPADLGRWAAEAIRGAMAKPPSMRAKAFTDAFGLTANGKRRSKSFIDVSKFMQNRLADGISLTRAKADAASRFGIDEQTAGRYWREYNKVIQESRAEE